MKTQIGYTDTFLKAGRYLFFITERIITKGLITETTQRKKILEYVAFINSHRIRQPISTMLGLLDLIQMNRVNEQEKERCIIHLKNCVDNLDKYSRELSEFIYKQQSDS